MIRRNGCYIIAEAGINHNGSLLTAFGLIDAAKEAGADCVKFQKRTLPDAVPESVRDIRKETPWGEMSYLEYRQRLEFSVEQYDRIVAYAKKRNVQIAWSVWDLAALELVSKFFTPPFIKVPSAKNDDRELLEKCQETNYPLIISTGMATDRDIDNIYYALGGGTQVLTFLHCVSSYPSDPRDVNLQAMLVLQKKFPNVVVGYSGHERGTQITLAAVALGAEVVERHITLDRTMWGTDQAASLEPHAFKNMVRDIRIIEEAYGDGKKEICDSEIPIMEKLRG